MLTMGLNYDDIKRLSPDAQAQIMKQLGLPENGVQALREVARRRACKVPPKQSKYHAEKDERNGIRFDSKREASRYDELVLMLKAGTIRDLKLQPEYTLIEAYRKPENGELVRAMRYRADFSYERRIVDAWGYERWLPTVEDVKGYRTKEYALKKKQFRERFGFDISEI